MVRGALPGQTSAGATDAFLQKYDSAGNLIWSRQFGSTRNDEAQALARNGSFVYVCGRLSDAADLYLRKIGLDGSLIWARQFGPPQFDSLNALAADSSGVYVAGFSVVPGNTATDGFAQKFDHAGNSLWTQPLGDAIPRAIRLSGSDVYFLVGGGLRILDTNGGSLRSRHIGGERALGMAVEGSSFYFAGSVNIPGQTFDTDAFVKRLDLVASLSAALRYVPVAACRLFDTGFDSDSGLEPSPLRAFEVRTFLTLQSRRCVIPADAQVFSLQVTAFPREPLGYLTVWPANLPRPHLDSELL